MTNDIKTGAVGFLYALSTDSDVRDSWTERPKWEDFFDMNSEDDCEVVENLDDIGKSAKSGLPATDVVHKKWKEVVVSMHSLIERGLIEQTLNIDGYDGDTREYRQKLASNLAKIVFDESAKENFTSNAALGLEVGKGSNENELQISAELRDALILLSNLISEEKLDDAAALLRGELTEQMVLQYIEEQSLIW